MAYVAPSKKNANDLVTDYNKAITDAAHSNGPHTKDDFTKAAYKMKLDLSDIVKDGSMSKASANTFTAALNKMANVAGEKGQAEA